MGRVFCTFFVLLGIISLGTTSAVIAADESPAEAGPYVVGGIGLVNYNVTSDDLRIINTALVNLGFSSSLSTTDNRGVYFKLHGGFNINKTFAVEGGYTSLGKLDINTTLTGPSETVKWSYKVYGLEASGLGKIEIGDSFAYLRIGVIAWDIDHKAKTSAGTGSAALDGTDATVGIGWQFGNGVRVESQYYPIGDTEIQTFHLSGVYSF